MADNNGRQRFYITEQLSDNISKTPEGYLLCENVPVTRIGEFMYRDTEVPVEADASGMVRIQRDESEVFNDDTIASLTGKPVCIDHPEEPVTSENWQQLAVGTTQNPRRGEGAQSDLMIADLLITREDAIELVLNGLREISLGYDANYEQVVSGLGKQKDIIMNHVALVAKGRAGGRCAISDKACTGCGTCNCDNKAEEEVGMKFKDKISELKKWLDRCPVRDADEDLEEKKKAEDQKEDLPKKLEDIKDTYDKWLKDAAEGKLDVSKLPVELKNVKDQDEEEEEFEKKQKDRKSKDQKEDEEEVTEDEDEEEKFEKKAMDKKFKDQEEELEDLKKNVSDLRDAVESLAKSGEETEEAMDRKFRDDEGAAKAEEAEKATVEAKNVGDAWPEILHRVEILNPGMRLRKPTKDHGRILREIKMNALVGAYTRDEDRESVEVFVRDGNFADLSKERLDAAFIGASELIAKANNRKVHRGSMTHDFKEATTVRSINEKNKAFYQKGKAA